MLGSFNLRPPPFHKQIRKVLGEYPDGAQILSELIQNADDARATKICFILDRRSNTCGEGGEGAEGLLIPQRFCGPALVCYNDSIFYEKDFESLTQPFDSNKQDDVEKIGKYGIGFMSVYHWTDIPMLLSDESLVFIDPHTRHFHGRSGTRANFVKERFSETHSMQLELFQVLPGKKLDFTKEFKGTVFRLPLRTETDSLESLIKNEACSVQKIRGIFASFALNSSDCLLFLNFLESIEFYEISDGESSARLLSSIKISNIEIIRTKRRLLANNVKRFMNDPNASDATTHFEATIRQAISGDKPILTNWLVMGELSSALRGKYVNLCATNKLLPWVGIAVDMRRLDEPIFQKCRLHCFLPMPISTTLPIHVNACFAVDSNRRTIKGSSDDLIGISKDLADWNTDIIQYAVKLYAKCLRHITGVGKKESLKPWPARFYELLILQDESIPMLSNLTEPLIRHLLSSEVSFLFEEGGRWTAASDCLTLVSNLTAQELDSFRPIIKAMKLCGQDVVTNVPTTVIELLCGLKAGHKLDPRRVRWALRNNMDWTTSFSSNEKLLLLSYILSDEDLEDLYQIPLIPILKENAFVELKKEEKPLILVDNDSKVLGLLRPRLDGRLVNVAILNPIALSSLKRVAGSTGSGLVIFEPSHLLSIFKENFLEYQTESVPDGIEVDIDWLHKLWSWLREFPNEISAFNGWHFLPCYPRNELAPLRCDSPLLFSEDLAVQDMDLLVRLGCKFLTRESNIVEQVKGFIQQNPKEHGFVVQFQFNNVLQALKRWRDFLAQLSLKESERLRDIILDLAASDHRGRSINNAMLATLKSLPIYCHPGELAVGSGPLLSPITDDEKGYLARSKAPSNVLIAQFRICLIDEFSLKESYLVTDVLKQPRLDPLPYWIKFVLPYVATQKLVIGQETLRNFIDELFSFYAATSRDLSLRDAISRFEFIPVNQVGAKLHYAAPRDLLDPHVPALLRIYQKQSKFPTSRYESREEIAKLYEFGLKQDLALEDIIDQAHLLCKNTSEFSEDSIAALIEYLDEHFERLKNANPEEKMKEVEDIKLFPAVKGTGDLFLTRGVECKPQSYKYLSNAVAITSIAIRSEGLRSRLGWNNSPPLDTHILQLKFFSEKSSLDSEDEFQIRQIYSSMNGIILRNNLKLDLNILTELRRPTLKWILIDGNLFSCETVAMDMPVGCSKGCSLYPFQALVPKTFFDDYPALFTRDIIPETFSAEKTFDLVCDLYKRQCEGISLSKEDISVSVSSLEVLASLGTSVYLAKTVTPDLFFAPTANDILMPIRNIYYPDIDGKQTIEDLEKLHPDVSKKVAKQLRITFESNLVDLCNNEDILEDEAGLGDMTELFNSSLWTSEVREDHTIYGESLLTCLRNKLEDYSESTIFNEFLQNADDAGAKNLKVILDVRTRSYRGGEALLSPAMAEWMSGPCLWIFNDGLFKTSDWRGILRIGSGSKREEAVKIGKFGYGFCSVFHFTDIPSILSGERFLQFDPHKWYLRKNTFFRVKYMESEWISKYPDHFAAAEALGLDPSMPFEGTLFRIPLRHSRELAGRSEIRSQISSGEDIMKLMEGFESDCQNSLLFLRNIEKVEAQVLSDDYPVNPIVLWTVSLLSITPEDRKRRNAIKKYFCHHSEEKLEHHGEFLPSNSVLKECHVFELEVEHQRNARGILYGKPAVTLHKKRQRWLIGSGVPKAEVLSRSFSDDHLRFLDEKKLVPFGGVAINMDDPKSYKDGAWTTLNKTNPYHVQDILLPPETSMRHWWIAHYVIELLKACAEHSIFTAKGHRAEERNLISLSNGVICHNYMEFIEELLAEPSFSRLRINFISMSRNIFRALEILAKENEVKIEFFTSGWMRDVLGKIKLFDFLEKHKSKKFVLSLIEYVLSGVETLDSSVANLDLFPLVNGTWQSMGKATSVSSKTRRFFINSLDLGDAELRLAFGTEYDLRFVDSNLVDLKSVKRWIAKIPSLPIHLFTAALYEELLHEILAKLMNQSFKLGLHGLDFKRLNAIWKHLILLRIDLKTLKGVPLLVTSSEDVMPLEFPALLSDKTGNTETANLLRALNMPTLHKKAFCPEPQRHLKDVAVPLTTQSFIMMLCKQAEKTGMKPVKYINSHLSDDERELLGKKLCILIDHTALEQNAKGVLRDLQIWKAYIPGPDDLNTELRPLSNVIILPNGLSFIWGKPGRCYLDSIPTLSKHHAGFQIIVKKLNLSSLTIEGYLCDHVLVSFPRQLTVERNGRPTVEIERYREFLKRAFWHGLVARLQSCASILDMQGTRQFPSSLYSHHSDFHNVVFEGAENFMHPSLRPIYGTAVMTAALGMKSSIDDITMREAIQKVDLMYSHGNLSMKTDLLRRASMICRSSRLSTAILHQVNGRRFIPLTTPSVMTSGSFYGHYPTAYEGEYLGSWKRTFPIDDFEEVFTVYPVMASVNWNVQLLNIPMDLSVSARIEHLIKFSGRSREIISENVHQNNVQFKPWMKCILKRLYTYLQNAMNNHEMAIKSCLKDKEVFYNNGKWVAASHLLIGIDDEEIEDKETSQTSRGVSLFLQPFTDLLRLLGADDIYRRVAGTFNRGLQKSTLQSTMLKLLAMSLDVASPLSDITFSFPVESSALSEAEKPKIHAHKAVLAATSEFFKKAFDNEWEEASKSEWEIKNFSADAFRLYLYFLYNSDLTLLDPSASFVNEDTPYMTETSRLIARFPNLGDQKRYELAMELLKVADMYLDENLKKRVEYFLLSFLQSGTVEELKELAITYRAEQLKRACDELLKKLIE
ncbi:hypothetical protein HDU67_005759 [Dinochytrium kinnereticum]|nr:hypothetical protein HDU67_005759 [Dinochytrium kinnereticum]